MSDEDQWIGFKIEHAVVTGEVLYWQPESHLRLTDLALSIFYQTQTHTTFPRPGAVFYHYIDWILQLFPKIRDTEPILPHPYTWDQLFELTGNIGTIDEAAQKAQNWMADGEKVAYWTGGLEFTEGQYLTVLFLEKYKIVMGIEPWVYPEQMGKHRGVLAPTAVPTTLWSKLLENRIYIFEIPRPWPENQTQLDPWYDDLYRRVTNRNAAIVVSEADRYLIEKKKRGPVVQVPYQIATPTTDIFFG